MSFQRINHGEELPKFLPISKELGWNRRDGWKKDRINPKYLFEYICERFLGKSADWAYSYYCSQPKRYSSWDFWDYFERSEYARNRFGNCYYVEDGIIVYKPRYSKPFKKTFTSPDFECVKGYVKNKKEINLDYVKTEDLENHVWKYFVKGNRDKPYQRTTKGYEITFTERSKEFYKLRYENTQAWRKWRKESKKTKYQGYELTDGEKGKGNKRAIKRQIRKERQLELKKLEKAKNEEIMVRLGFDPVTSFRK